MKENKYVVITGASSGIGYNMALEFAKLGKNLVLVARRTDKLNELKKNILNINNKLDVIISTTDLSIMENVYTFYNSLKNLEIEVFINNAGFGNFSNVADQDLNKIQTMLKLNIEALTILSTLYVKDYQNIEGSQLINVSSTGGYAIVNEAIPYCASKFYVSSFTEGLDQELKLQNFKLRAKVLAPSATETEFMIIAKDVDKFNYEGKFHTSKEMAQFAIELYKSDKTVGIVDLQDFSFKLQDPTFPFRHKGATQGK